MKILFFGLIIFTSFSVFAKVEMRSAVICEQYISVSDCSDIIYQKTPTKFFVRSIAYAQKKVVRKTWLVDSPILGEEKFIEGSIHYSSTFESQEVKGEVKRNEVDIDLEESQAKLLCTKRVEHINLSIESGAVCEMNTAN